MNLKARTTALLCTNLVSAILLVVGGCQERNAGNNSESFCTMWALLSEEQQDAFLEVAMPKLMGPTPPAEPNVAEALVDCATRGMAIQKPTISQTCKERDDYTVGLLMGQLSIWLAIECSKDSSFVAPLRRPIN
jgi:hypothetical protein